MKLIIEITLGVLVAAAILVTLIFAAKKYVRIHAEKQKGALGIDWKYIRDSSNFFNAAGRVAAELKFAFQRFSHGFDHRMFQNFHNYIDYLIIEDLRYMIEHRSGSPHIEEVMDETSRTLSSDGDDEGDKKFHRHFMEILKEMLFHFEQSKDEYCLEKNEEPPEMLRKYSDRQHEIERYQAEHHSKAMKMFQMYSDYLWD
jgi:hypothetical protein